MAKQLLAKTKNGAEVYVDMELSHAATHFKDHPPLLEFTKKALAEIEPAGEHIRTEVDLGIPVGMCDLVETTDADEIVYAMRPGRTQYSRFAKNKQPHATTWVTVDMYRAGLNAYDLYTAFAGRLTPSFPGEDYLPEQSKEFWSTHALVWGSQEVVPGTETTTCPW